MGRDALPTNGCPSDTQGLLVSVPSLSSLTSSQKFSYIVPDSSLALASSTLSQILLPLSSADPFLVSTDGDFYAKATLHRLTRATDPGSVRYIALYPSSFAPFISSDLNLGNSCTHEAFSGIPVPQTAILIPKPPAVFTFILRLLTRYPRDSATRSALLADL